jgi:hypothetical protein
LRKKKSVTLVIIGQNKWNWIKQNVGNTDMPSLMENIMCFALILMLRFSGVLVGVNSISNLMTGMKPFVITYGVKGVFPRAIGEK